MSAHGVEVCLFIYKVFDSSIVFLVRNQGSHQFLTMQVLLIFSFFLGVHALAIEQRSSCISPDVVAVARQVSDPHYFCAWYLNE